MADIDLSALNRRITALCILSIDQALATFAVAGLSSAFGTGRLFSENPPRRLCIPSSLSWLEQVVQAMRRTHIIRSDKRGTTFRGLNLSLSRSY